MVVGGARVTLESSVSSAKESSPCCWPSSTRCIWTWLTESVIEGRIPFKGGVAAFMSNREKACWAEWVGPPAPTADDLKSAKAATERLGNRTSSLAIESTAVGYDPQDIAQMRSEDIKLYQGLDMGDPYIPAKLAVADPSADPALDPVPANG